MWFALLAIVLGQCMHVQGSSRTLKLALTRSYRRDHAAKNLLVKNFKPGHGFSKDPLIGSAPPLDHSNVLPLRNPSNFFTVGSTPTSRTTHIASAAAHENLNLIAAAQKNLKEFREGLTNLGEVFYYAWVQIGTPAVSVRLIFDTGSSDIWVKPKYSPAKSSTAHVEDNTISIKYGQGQMEGTQAFDLFCLTSSENESQGSFCLDQMALVAANQISGIGDDAFYDGLIGAAFPMMNQENQMTFLQQISNQMSYKQPAFGLALSSLSPCLGADCPVSDDESFVTFGELDDLLQEAVSEKSLSGIILPLYGIGGKSNYWMVNSSLNYNGTQKQMYAITDSGSSLIVFPNSLYNQMISYILPDSSSCQEISGSMVCTCTTELRPFSFTFYGYDVNGYGEKAITIQLDRSDLFSELEGIYCRFNVMKSGQFPFVLLGDAFLRKVYAVHDWGALQLTLFPNTPTMAKTTSQRLSGSVIKTRAASRTTWFPNHVLHRDDMSNETLLLCAIAVLGLLAGGVLWYRRHQRAVASREITTSQEDGKEAPYVKL